ncbi:MAG TPA: Ig-like domain-containing protein, partial [Urbifossiella sp.]|nr:Ig-like domain-containing protein [Urbifossiella sp.]
MRWRAHQPRLESLEDRTTPAGTLDPSFGTDGRAFPQLGCQGAPKAVAVQPDGSVLIAGISLGSSGEDFTISRLTSDGRLDSGFGTGGVVTFDLGGFDMPAAIALQPDGSVVVAGTANLDTSGDFAVVRLTPAGHLDPSFGSGGIAKIDFGGTNDEAVGVAVQADGTILIGGDSNHAFAAVRLTSAGQLDPTFGTGGRVVDGTGPAVTSHGMVIQSGGKIVLAGDSQSGLTGEAVRFTAAGQLDPTFGTGGRAGAGFGALQVVNDVALQADGKLILAGTTGLTNQDFAAARLTADGQPDPTFGTGGQTTIDFGAEDSVARVAVLPGGAIVLAGSKDRPQPVGPSVLDDAVARLTPGGSLDPAFGVGGSDLFPYSGFDFVNGLAVSPDGQAVIVGTYLNAGLNLSLPMVTRLTGDPPPPAVSFSVNGYTTPGNAMSVATGDFNHDGKIDAAAGSSGGVTVFLNDGHGGMGTGTTMSTGSASPHSIRVADITGDGNPDIIAANDSGQSLSVFVGNGNGTFQTPVVVPVGGANIQGLVVADFDGDHELDVAVVEDDRLAVLLNVGGTGILGVPMFFSVGTGGRAIDTADFNADGKADLVVADTNDDELVVFPGNGNGTFGTGVALPTGAGSQPYAVISRTADGRPLDLNGDGHPDLAAGYNGNGLVGVLLGDGAGGFSSPILSATGSPRAGRLTAADFDADGYLDLAVDVSGLLSPPSQAVLTGDGTGQFAAAEVGVVGDTDVAAADLNGDGLPDFVGTLDFNPGALDVALNTTPLVASFQVSAPSKVTIGVPFTITVTAKKADGTTFTDYKGPVRFTSSDGAAVLPPDGRFSPSEGGVRSYTVTLNALGAQSFTVGDQVRTGVSLTAPVTVYRVNHNPTAGSDTLTMAEDDPATVVPVLGNDSTAPDAGETLTITAVTQPAHGSVTLVGGVVKYVPAANYNGTDSFTYTISDGFTGPNGPGTATGTVNVTVTPVNDPPIAVDDALVLAEDSPPTAVDVLANDSFAPDTGETLTVMAVTQPAHGVVTLVGGVVKYAPAPNYNGMDSFTYTISDGNGGTATATVSVTVTPVNDPPTANPDGFSLAYNAPATTLAVLANDTAAPDAGETLAVVAVTQPAAGGTVAIAPGGAGVVFTPAAKFSGTATFAYTVGDGTPGSTATATVTVTVADPPALSATRPVAVGGSPDGSITLTTAAGTTTTISPFGNTGAVTRTATGDVDGDGVADVVAVTGPGTALRLAVLSGADGHVLVAPFDPFGGNFPGGGYVAAADLDGDGKAEFAVTPDQGGGPRVTLFSLAGGQPRVEANFFGIDDTSFRGGARAALGDVNHDGTADLVVAAGFGGGPRVAVFDGKTVLGTPTRLVPDFFAFPGSDAVNLRNGAFVAAGDVTGDGFADLVFGGGPGGAPRVFILSGALVSAGAIQAAYDTPVANFFVNGDTTGRGGARVAVTNYDGDDKADVVVGSGPGEPARVLVYPGS